MSTPKFIQEYVLGNSQQATNLVEGEAFGNPPSPTIILVQPVAEATLIEEVTWCATNENTDAGYLLLFVDYEDALGALVGVHLIGCYELEAGTATKMASGRISLGITLPVGACIYAMHNVKENGAGAYAFLSLLAMGGIVR